jgi:signal transduction histidine kinase
MLARVLPESIDFVTMTEPRLGRVCADRSQVEQVLMNLVVNARDAMPDGGTLTIGVNEVAGPEGDEPFLEIVVRDSGTGIPADMLNEIFEPFFTTKLSENGSGLGLSMVGGFAARAGGDITVESEVGKGTAFVIRVPEVRAAAPRQDRAAGGGTSPRPRVGRRVKAMQPSAAHFQARPG